MANIKITNGIGGSFPAQTVLLAFDMLNIKTSTGSQRTYPVKHSIVSLDIVSEHGKSVVFDMKLNDGSHFRAEGDKKTVHHLMKFVGAAPVASQKIQEKSKAQVNRDSTIAGIIALVVISFVLYKCSGDSAPSAPKPLTDDSARPIGATLCEHRVKGMLKSPSTADFPFVSGAAIISMDRQSITYTSYVDSQNGFGATIRTHFLCELNLTGSNPDDVHAWGVKDVAFLR
jgi:hypothetical protein